MYFGFGFEFLNINITSKKDYRLIQSKDITFSTFTSLVSEIYTLRVLEELAISTQIGVFQPKTAVLAILVVYMLKNKYSRVHLCV